MKTVAVLIYAEALESTVAECRRQIDLIPSDEYTFELFVNPDLDEAWRAAGERDFYIWLHGLVTPVEGALYSLLDNSSFLGDRALLVGTVQDGEGHIVSGGFSRSRRLMQPDPVIPVACRMFDGLFALVPQAVYRRIGVLGGRYRGQPAIPASSRRGSPAPARCVRTRTAPWPRTSSWTSEPRDCSPPSGTSSVPPSGGS